MSQRTTIKADTRRSWLREHLRRNGALTADQLSRAWTRHAHVTNSPAVAIMTIDTVQRDLNAMVRAGELVRQRDPDGKHSGHGCNPTTCRVTFTRYVLA